jgi:hypothetical protein
VFTVTHKSISEFELLRKLKGLHISIERAPFIGLRGAFEKDKQIRRCGGIGPWSTGGIGTGIGCEIAE